MGASPQYDNSETTMIDIAPCFLTHSSWNRVSWVSLRWKCYIAIQPL